MKSLRALSVVSLSATLLASAAFGCGRSSKSDAPAIPASSDPQGNDLVEGAIVAADESNGGYRLYKILHVDTMPEPFGVEYHMAAYDPKGATIEEALHLWKQGKAKVMLAHFEVRKIYFIKRDHRVLAIEPVTEEERAPYLKSRDSRK